MMPAAAKTRKPTFARRLFDWVAIAVVLLAVLSGVMVLNNNYSLRSIPRADFSSQLDRAIESSTQWIVKHPEIQGNPSLMFMVGDMARMSAEPRLHSFVESYLASPRVRVPGQPLTWYYARLADPQAPVPPIMLNSNGTFDELLWDSYAAAPDRLSMSAADRAAMFSPTRYYWGRRNHQLLALDIYRQFNGTSPDLDATMHAVSNGVARDAFWDFRVNDAYEQRSAFVLGAGRPTLIRSRWIERILSHQRADGSWSTCWYGWCRGIFEFSLADRDPGHATVQAAWALYQLKYRYSDWINRHYH